MKCIWRLLLLFFAVIIHHNGKMQILCDIYGDTTDVGYLLMRSMSMVRERERRTCSHSTNHTCPLKSGVCHSLLSHNRHGRAWKYECVISNVADIDWDIHRNWDNTLHCVSYLAHIICWLFSTVPSCFIFLPYQMQCWKLRASHIWQKKKWCSLLKRTRESHWFTDWQTVIFHSLPQHSLHWQNTSLMCSQIKMLPRVINDSTPLPFISLHQITWLLTKWTATPSGKHTVCISFGQNETRLIYLSSRALCF